MPDVATLRLSREQNQARLNYAEAKQGRPKVNLMDTMVDPHVATLLGMTFVCVVIARLGTSRGNLTKSRDSHGRYAPRDDVVF